MRTKPFNPARNVLPPGIKEENLIKAIGNSGYPLQGLIARKLSNNTFVVTEEWAFNDRDTKEPRTLDLAAFRVVRSADWTDVAPGLFLLIECKKSTHPYVFFRSLADQDMSWFPCITGLPHSGISMMHEVDGMRAVQCTVPGSAAFGLDSLPFVASGPDMCAAFSRAEAKGNNVVLSGTEVYNGVVMPLVSACEHAMLVHRHTTNELVLLTLVICIVVLDAPIILVESPECPDDPICSPWVRVIRQEPDVNQFGGTIRQYAVDAVHIDYFDTFIKEHVLPFASDFGKHAIQLGAGPVLRGAYVPDITNWKWDQITEYKGQ